MFISHGTPRLMNSNIIIAPIERFAHIYGKRVGQILMFLILLFLWIPMGVLVVMSFARDEVLSFPPEEFTLYWYGVFLNNSDAIGAMITSFQVGITATVITVILAILIAYSLDRYLFPGRETLQMLTVLPIIIPLVIVGIALLLFFGAIGTSLGFRTTVIAHVVRTIPFATLVILPAFVALDPSLEEASKDLGANELETFIRVTLPNISPAVVAAALLTFTFSFNEFVYTYFVSGGNETLPVYIWNRIMYVTTPEVNVISVVFLVTAISLVIGALLLTRTEYIVKALQ